MHPSKRTYGYSTRQEHMPETHRQHATWTPERILEWAAHIGSDTHRYVLHILNSRPHPEQSYRFCLGLMNLHKKYSKGRLNAACARALMKWSTKTGHELEFFQYRLSDSFGGNPPLYSCGLSAL